MQRIIEYFEKQPKIFQGSPCYIKDKPCCIGAHLAYLMFGTETYYTQGKNALVEGMKELGFKNINAAHICILLKDMNIFQVDKSNIKFMNPWSTDEWVLTPLEVFKQLATIEKLPNTNNIDYSIMDLEEADMQNGDFNNSNFYNIYARKVDFEGANLKNANFEGANLKGAKFKNANLENANFKTAVCVEANFEGANLKNANFEDAYIHYTNFKNTNTNL